MFHYLDKYARDDSLVKLVFDHLRNIGLGTLVLSAATWKQKHIGEGFVAILDHSAATMLAFIGVGQIWLNHENLFHKIRNTNSSKWFKLLFAIIYTVISIELFKFLQSGR